MMLDRLIKWLFFSILIALLPLAFTWIYSYINNLERSYVDIVGRGELLLISASICAAALGDLIGTSHQRKGTTIAAYIAGGSAVVILMLCSLLFASLPASPDPNGGAIAEISTLLYGVSVVSGGASILLGDM